MSEHLSSTLSIDTVKSRIRVHKNTLHLLNDPPYIQLLFDPDTLGIAVHAASKNIPRHQTIRVVMDRTGSAGSFDIYAHYLIQRIQQLVPALTPHGLYRLTGKLVPTECAVLFHINTLQAIIVPESLENIPKGETP